MATILQMTFSNVFYWYNFVVFWFKFRWSWFLGVQLTIKQHCHSVDNGLMVNRWQVISQTNYDIVHSCHVALLDHINLMFLLALAVLKELISNQGYVLPSRSLYRALWVENYMHFFSVTQINDSLTAHWNYLEWSTCSENVRLKVTFCHCYLKPCPADFVLGSV